MKKELSKELFVSLLLVLTTGLVSCAPREAPAANPVSPSKAPSPQAAAPPALTPDEAAWQTTLAEARKEGRVVLYTSFGGAELRSALDKAMAEHYGIRIDWMVNAGPVNAERIRVEQRSKQYTGDLMWSGGSPLMLKTMRSVGALQPYTPPAVIRDPGVWDGKGVDSFTDKRDALTISQGLSTLSLVNTSLLTPQVYPRSYLDLLEPRWKGRIVLHDPAIPGSGNIVFGLVKRAFGLEYWEKMKGQQIAVIRDYGEIGRRVAAGEALLGAAMSISQFMPLLSSGAPVAPIPIAEGAIKAPYLISLLNQAPHSSAAKVFINWTLSREGQVMIFDHLGLEPIRKDVSFNYHPKVEAAVRAMPKWLIYSFEVAEDFEEEITKGTARQVLGLK